MNLKFINQNFNTIFRILSRITVGFVVPEGSLIKFRPTFAKNVKFSLLLPSLKGVDTKKLIILIYLLALKDWYHYVKFYLRFASSFCNSLYHFDNENEILSFKLTTVFLKFFPYLNIVFWNRHFLPLRNCYFRWK